MNRKFWQEVLGRGLYLSFVLAVVYLVNMGGFMVFVGLVEGSYRFAFFGAAAEVLAIVFAAWCEMFTAAPWRELVSLRRLR